MVYLVNNGAYNFWIIQYVYSKEMMTQVVNMRYSCERSHVMHNALALACCFCPDIICTKQGPQLPPIIDRCARARKKTRRRETEHGVAPSPSSNVSKVQLRPSRTFLRWTHQKTKISEVCLCNRHARINIRTLTYQKMIVRVNTSVLRGKPLKYSVRYV